MYAERLKYIDWEAAIATQQDWTDPNFSHDVNSLLDEHIANQARHEQWRRYTWKRPQEVYGEGNFILYDQPQPSDIL